MNILLIQPKMNKRPMDTDLKTRMAPSLALLTLRKLTPEGHNVYLLNENVEVFSANKRYFGAEPIHLVAITVTVDVMPRAVAVARHFRKCSVPVVAGGIHVTCDPEGCAMHFDAICVGMAERVWGNILYDVQAGALQAVYRDMDGMTGAEICPPDYAFAKGQQQYLYTNVLTTSRGCPHRCDFCYNSCACATPYMNRPIDDVLADIRAIGTRHLMFIDDNFCGSPEWTREFLMRIRGMGLTWHAAVTTRIGRDPDLLALMAEVGCQSLFIGFESVCPEALAGVHKQNVVGEYGALIRSIHAHGIMVHASMVFGLDGEDEGVFDATLDFLVKNKVETLTAHILTPYPGTALYGRMRAQGRLTDLDLAHYNTARVVFRPQGMTDQVLSRGYLRMYRRFYSFANIWRRMPERKEQRRAYWLFNLLYRKYGRVTAFVAKFVPMGTLGRIAARASYRV